MNRPLVIYHAHCADGFTAAWVAHRFFEGRGGCELLAATYGDAPPDVEGRDVVILDFSYRREVLLDMRARARSLVVIDHHQRTFDEHLHGLDFVVFDNARSGARLAWDHFYPHSVACPWIVEYVQDRDLWRWELPRSREVSAGLGSLEFDLATWTELDDPDRLMALADEGAAILRYQARVVRSHVERARPAMLAGHTVPVVNASTLISEIGNELAAHAPFAAMWFEVEGGFAYSLRSVASYPDHVDVSEIASRYGGGGHRHAAGFRSRHLAHELPG